MTFLELVQRLAQEMGGELTERITSVAIVPATSYGSSTEMNLRCVTWINQAWQEIQEDQSDWRFMVERGTMPLQQGQTTYDIEAHITADVGTDQYDGLLPFVAGVDLRYVWVVNTNTDPNQKSPCYYLPPEHYFGAVDRSITGQGQPSCYSIEPDGCIAVNKAPSAAGWELEFDYKLKPQTLAVDADEPRLPAKFHMLLVYWAMVEYADFDESDRQFKRAQRNYRRMRNKLRLEQLPEYTMPGTR